jgi:hypothetical protein
MLPTKKKAKPRNGFACKKVTNCFIILQGFLEWFLEWLLLPERLVAQLGRQLLQQASLAHDLSGFS